MKTTGLNIVRKLILLEVFLFEKLLIFIIFSFTIIMIFRI